MDCMEPCLLCYHYLVKSTDFSSSLIQFLAFALLAGKCKILVVHEIYMDEHSLLKASNRSFWAAQDESWESLMPLHNESFSFRASEKLWCTVQKTINLPFPCKTSVSLGSVFPINRPETHQLNLPFYCICSDIRNRYRDPACTWTIPDCPAERVQSKDSKNQKSGEEKEERTLSTVCKWHKHTLHHEKRK